MNTIPILLFPISFLTNFVSRIKWFFFIFTTMTQGFIALCQNISRVFQQLYSDLCYRGLRLDRYGNCSSILQRIDFRATDLFPVKEKLFSIFMKIIRIKERRTYQNVLERHFE